MTALRPIHDTTRLRNIGNHDPMRPMTHGKILPMERPTFFARLFKGRNTK